MCAPPSLPRLLPPFVPVGLQRPIPDSPTLPSALFLPPSFPLHSRPARPAFGPIHLILVSPAPLISFDVPSGDVGHSDVSGLLRGSGAGGAILLGRSGFLRPSAHPGARHGHRRHLSGLRTG